MYEPFNASALSSSSAIEPGSLAGKELSGWKEATAAPLRRADANTSRVCAPLRCTAHLALPHGKAAQVVAIASSGVARKTRSA